MKVRGRHRKCGVKACHLPWGPVFRFSLDDAPLIHAHCTVPVVSNQIPSDHVCGLWSAFAEQQEHNVKTYKAGKWYAPDGLEITDAYINGVRIGPSDLLMRDWMAGVMKKERQDHPLVAALAGPMIDRSCRECRVPEGQEHLTSCPVYRQSITSHPLYRLGKEILDDPLSKNLDRIKKGGARGLTPEAISLLMPGVPNAVVEKAVYESAGIPGPLLGSKTEDQAAAERKVLSDELHDPRIGCGIRGCPQCGQRAIPPVLMPDPDSYSKTQQLVKPTEADCEEGCTKHVTCRAPAEPLVGPLAGVMPPLVMPPFIQTRAEMADALTADVGPTDLLDCDTVDVAYFDDEDGEGWKITPTEPVV